jgi:hypothetical protein
MVHFSRGKFNISENLITRQLFHRKKTYPWAAAGIAIQGIPGISPPKLEMEHGRNISLCLFWLIKIVIELEVVISIPHSTGRSKFPLYIIDQNYYLIRR